MDPSPEQVRGLLQLVRRSRCAHSEEILPLLENVELARRQGVTISLFEMPLASGDLRGTYRLRAEMLTERETRGTLCDPSPSGRILPPTLAADLRELSAALDDARDQVVAIWDIRMPDWVCYGIFVLMDDARIAGAYKSIEEAH